MARKNEFKKEKYKGIMSLENADGSIHYYANFMLGGVSYQKKNLTKLRNVETAAKARDELENIKSELRKGKNPFGDTGGDKVKDIILKSISKRDPKGKSSAYKKSLEGFYYKYIDLHIGHLFLGKVTDRHVEKIMDPLENYKKEYKLNVQILMFKIFETEFRKGNIRHNPFYKLDYGTHKRKASFDTRLNEPIEGVARKLYKTVLEYDSKYRLVLLMSIMTARRIGEIHQLRLRNIKKFSDGDWYILVNTEITKTDEDEKYPLPIEAIKLLPLNLLEDEQSEDTPLFDFSMSSILLNYKKLVKKANIDINKNLNKDTKVKTSKKKKTKTRDEYYSLTSHDNRKMFLSILSSLGTDSDLADRCLSHKGKGGMKDVYWDISYRIRKEIFEEWWTFLRT